MEEYLEFAKDIASYAGKVIKKYFYSENKNTEYKDDRTPVTLADKEINSYLIDKVKEKYPSHGVLGEEESYQDDKNYVWVCDPLDGTSMFIRHLPVCVFSLALVVSGNPIVGVVYDPFLDEIYTAIKDQGAYLNGNKIYVNDLEYGQLGCSVDCYMWNTAKYDTLDIIRDIRSDVKTFEAGSVAHGCMLVASGKISGVIFPGTVHANCDIAASKLIVEEAGGMVTDFYGNDQRYDRDIDGAIITNGKLHKKILEKVNNNIE